MPHSPRSIYASDLEPLAAVLAPPRPGKQAAGILDAERRRALASGPHVDELARLSGAQNAGHHIDGMQRQVERAAVGPLLQNAYGHVGQPRRAVVGHGAVLMLLVGHAERMIPARHLLHRL